MKKFSVIILSITFMASLLHKESKLKEFKVPQSIDIRSLELQKENDNPLSELWDTNHMKVARQKVEMNMNVPLNRLKLDLDDSYVVKIVVHSDEDFNSLYKYFHGKENIESLK